MTRAEVWVQFASTALSTLLAQSCTSAKKEREPVTQGAVEYADSMTSAWEKRRLEEARC